VFILSSLGTSGRLKLTSIENPAAFRVFASRDEYKDWKSKDHVGRFPSVPARG
jgi:hypothetical protein